MFQSPWCGRCRARPCHHFPTLGEGCTFQSPWCGRCRARHEHAPFGVIGTSRFQSPWCGRCRARRALDSLQASGLVVVSKPLVWAMPRGLTFQEIQVQSDSGFKALGVGDAARGERSILWKRPTWSSSFKALGVGDAAHGEELRPCSSARALVSKPLVWAMPRTAGLVAYRL